MKSQTVVKLIVGLVVIGGGISYFMYQAMQSSWSYYYSVDDFAANSAVIKNNSLRIAGVVKPGSVMRDLEKMSLSFILAGSRSEVSVSYNGVPPDNFAENGEVVVDGSLDNNGTFQAETVMTKCESKYKAKVK